MRQEIRQFHAHMDCAVYLGLCKTGIVYSPGELTYRLFYCHPKGILSSQAVSADFHIFYFLCSTEEIADFFSGNFRNVSPALYLLNSSHYSSEHKLLQFQNLYRLPACSIYPLASNLAFQAAISENQENHFFSFYHHQKLFNQNYDFLKQLKDIHFLVLSHTKGDLPWNETTYF